MFDAGKCEQAWPAGIDHGILVDCVKTKRHWKHQNARGDLSWHGPPLTAAEIEDLNELRMEESEMRNQP